MASESSVPGGEFEFVEVNLCAPDGFCYVSQSTPRNVPRAEQYALACAMRDKAFAEYERVEFRFYIDLTAGYYYDFRQTAEPQVFTRTTKTAS